MSSSGKRIHNSLKIRYLKVLLTNLVPHKIQYHCCKIKSTR